MWFTYCMFMTMGMRLWSLRTKQTFVTENKSGRWSAKCKESLFVPHMLSCLSSEEELPRKVRRPDFSDEKTVFPLKEGNGLFSTPKEMRGMDMRPTVPEEPVDEVMERIRHFEKVQNLLSYLEDCDVAELAKMQKLQQSLNQGDTGIRSERLTAGHWDELEEWLSAGLF